MTIEVERKVVVPAAVDDVWQAIGDFGAMATWHPKFATCDVERNGQVVFRHLRTVDGGEYLEREVAEHDNANGHSYSYEIVSSPLPVSNYRSIFRVLPHDDGTRVEWTSHFEAEGVPAAEAAHLIAGIYETGLEGIKQRFA